MPDFRFAFLTSQDLPLVREVFHKAFADYVVPVQLSEEQLQDKVEREGIAPNCCVGAFAGGEMVGFILTGLGEWQGKPTAYNAGTGVVPGFRGHGLTQQMYAFLLPKLREQGVEQCLLEVIQGNTPALKAYQQIGFKITRSLSCFRSMGDLLLEAKPPGGIVIAQAIQPDALLYTSFCEVEPTWQNSTEALHRSMNQAQTLEARDEHQGVVGYISFFQRNGAVAQLAVAAQWRNQGIATALLREAVKRVEVPSVMFLNIEDRAQRMISFLQNRRLRLLLKQYEMLLPLT